MSKPRRQVKDRTSLVIAAVLHLVLIGAVGYWAHKTGRLEKIRQVLLQYASDKKEKKEEAKPPVQQTQRSQPQNLPPIDTGRAPRMGDGVRRAVAADAPDAPGDTFFDDTRKQVAGAASRAGGTTPTPKAVSAPPPPTSPRLPPPAFRAATASSVKQLLVERAKAAAATESFGAEQISRTGASDAGAIIGKVSGSTVVDNKFAVIRGLSDRYVTTTLNGAEVPSADPYRRSASLDLFPAQVIDRVVVAKTFTPDQPGSYTGGGIDVVTKSFPARRFMTLSLGAAYNTQATGNDEFLTYKGGDLDWAGVDDGTRALPDALSADDLVVPQAPFTSGTATSPTYPQRVAEANLLQDQTRSLGVTEFRGTKEAPPPNQSFSFATGDTAFFFGKPFGYFAGMSYKHDFSFYQDGIARRHAPGDGKGEYDVRSDYTDTRAVETVNWAGVVNLAYQVHPDHELGFNFLYNQNGEDLVRHQDGTRLDDPGTLFHLRRLHFTERNLNTFQLKGNHTLENVGNLRMDWMTALSTTSQDEPDTRFFNYAEESGVPVVGKASIPEPRLPTRYFRELDEDNLNAKFDFTLPVRTAASNQGLLKAGFFDSGSERTFRDREFYYQGSAPWNGDPNVFLTPDNLGYLATTNRNNGRISYDWQRYIQSRESAYDGDYTIRAGYFMLDLALATGVRLVGGVRRELTDIEVNSRSYLANSVTGQSTNTAVLDQKDILPAAGLIVNLRSNMTVRLHYSQTIARPSFRELAAYRSYDPVLDELLDGNPTLQMTAISNYDFRWEWFPRPGELFSVSAFYKTLDNPIERRYVTIDGEIITYANRSEAEVWGLEFEVRKGLDIISPHLARLSAGINLSLIGSETPLTEEELVAKSGVVTDLETTRPLYDQSPYLVNLDLTYDNPGSGTTATVVFSIAGPRITIASLNTEDIYEQPAPQLDIVLSQRLRHGMRVTASARNLLDPYYERTYGDDPEGPLYSSYTRGMTFGLSLGFDF